MKEQQELMFKFSILEQQMQQIHQQLQAVEQGLIEINSLSLGLDDLVGSTGKEILAPIGRGIFVKTKLLSEELTVDIGERTFIKKTIPETKEIIAQQVLKLENVKVELNDNLEKIGFELNRLISEAQEKERAK